MMVWCSPCQSLNVQLTYSPGCPSSPGTPSSIWNHYLHSFLLSGCGIIIHHVSQCKYFRVFFPSFSSSLKSKSLSRVPLFVTPWNSPLNSPGQNTGVGSCSLLQGIFPTQGLNPGLLHCRRILYCLSHQESPKTLEWVAYPFSRGSFWPRNRTRISHIAGGFFISWVTREDREYWSG